MDDVERMERRWLRKRSTEALGMQICGEQCGKVMRVEQNKYFGNQV